MEIGRLPWNPVPDDEFIAKTRKFIGFIDRFRLWWILLNIAALAIGGWVFTGVMEFVVNCAGNAKLPMAGFFMGAFIGVSASISGHHLFLNLIYAIANFRAERLMIKYHDALLHVAEERQQSSRPCDSDEALENTAM
jgi:hypothetical protein